MNSQQKISEIRESLENLEDFSSVKITTGIQLFDQLIATNLSEQIRAGTDEQRKSIPEFAAILNADPITQNQIWNISLEFNNKIAPLFPYNRRPENLSYCIQNSAIIHRLLSHSPKNYISPAQAYELIHRLIESETSNYRRYELMPKIKELIALSERSINYRMDPRLKKLFETNAQNLISFERNKDTNKIRPSIIDFEWLEFLYEILGTDTGNHAVFKLAYAAKTQANNLKQGLLKSNSDLFLKFIKSRNHSLPASERPNILTEFKAASPEDRAGFVIEMFQQQDRIWQHMDFEDHGALNWVPRLHNFLLFGITSAYGYHRDNYSQKSYRLEWPIDQKTFEEMAKLKISFTTEQSIYLIRAVIGQKDRRWPQKVAFTRNVAAALSPTLPEADELYEIVLKRKPKAWRSKKDLTEILLNVIDRTSLVEVSTDEQYRHALGEADAALNKLVKANEDMIKASGIMPEPPTRSKSLIKLIFGETRSKRLERQRFIANHNYMRNFGPHQKLEEYAQGLMPGNFVTQAFLIENSKAVSRSSYWTVEHLVELTRACLNMGKFGTVPEKFIQIFREATRVSEEFNETRLDKYDQRASNRFMSDLNTINQYIHFANSLSDNERFELFEFEELAKTAPDTGSPTQKWLVEVNDFCKDTNAKLLASNLLQYLELQSFRSKNWSSSKIDNWFNPSQKGLLWAVSLFPSEEAAKVLESAAMKGFSSDQGGSFYGEKFANAAIWSLSELPDGMGAKALARISAKIPYPKVRAKVETAMNKAAEAAGISRDVLDEIVVPIYGFDQNGNLIVSIGDGAANLVQCTDGKIEIRWTSETGKDVKAPTTKMKEDAKSEIKQIKAQIKDMNQDLTTQKNRIQSFYLKNKFLPYENWKQSYIAHPFIGKMCQSLVWIAHLGDKAISGRWDGKDFRDLKDDTIDIEKANFQLWHPVLVDDQEVEMWRDKFADANIIQPFRQIWRESYRVTEAEQATDTYSNRFAGHIIRQHQFMKLAHINGWKTRHRMWVDAANDYPAHIVLPEYELYAEYWVEGAGGRDEPPVNDSCAYIYLNTDRLCFYKLNNDGRPGNPASLKGDAVSLDQISPIVFSEIMRHCDLFVSVATIARDPNWRDRGADARHPNSWYDREADRYWSNQSESQLLDSAKVRRDMLKRIIPSLKNSDQLSLCDKHLRVQGKLHKYKIHLGSGGVFCIDNNRHICIVPASGSKKMLLPFDQDAVLTLIVSKALLLLKDDKITDQVILRQLKAA